MFVPFLLETAMILLATILACSASAPEAVKDAGSGESADSTDTADTGASSEGLTYEAFVEAYVPLGCALLAECDGLDDMTYEECLPWLTEQVAATPCTTFDATAGAACLVATESATCADATEGDGSHFAACWEMCG
jgi:hypothetical protein